MMKQTPGEQLANSFSPFLDPRNAHKAEIVTNMAKTIDRNLKIREDVIKMLINFMRGETVKLGNLTYKKGVNEDSFLKTVISVYEIE